MKYILQKLGFAIIILWTQQSTIAVAALSEQQCKNKIDGMIQNYPKTDDLSTKYGYAKAKKELFERDCPFMEYAESNVSSALDTMGRASSECIEQGLGAECGVTSVESYTIYKDPRRPLKLSTDSPSQSKNDSPPPKKLTGAEQKRQQAQQKAEDLGAQSQQLAQENQSKADAARQGKRKKHDPAAEAHHCIKVNTGGSTGSMVNTCNFKISYVDCRYNNTSDELKNWLTCEKQKFGFGFIDAHNEDLTFTRKAQKIYWFACKEPSRPVDYNFVEGRGISGRCHDTANSD